MCEIPMFSGIISHFFFLLGHIFWLTPVSIKLKRKDNKYKEGIGDETEKYTTFAYTLLSWILECISTTALRKSPRVSRGIE